MRTKTIRRAAVDGLVTLGVVLAVALPAAVGWAADAAPAPVAAPPAKAAPPPIVVVLEGGGKFAVDGQPMADPSAMADTLKTKAAEREALRARMPAAGQPAAAPADVQLKFGDLEKIEYEDLVRVLMACGSAKLVFIDVGGGVPIPLPSPDPKRAVPVGAAPAEAPKLRPIVLTTKEDLPKIAEQKLILKGMVVSFSAWMDAPLSLVLPAIRALADAGADLQFKVPYFGREDEGASATDVVIEQAPPGSAPGIWVPRLAQKKAVKTKEAPTKTESRGKYKPGPDRAVQRFIDNPFPDVPAGNLRQPEVIGVGNGGNALGGFEGLGTGNGGFFGAGTEVVEEGPRKIVYVVDRGESTADVFKFIKMELKRSLSELAETHQFHIIFFSSGPAVENPPRRLVTATERNKQQAYEFIDGVVAQGKNDPTQAFAQAFACKPELVYFLSGGGAVDKEVVALVKRLNTGGKVTVHAIGFVRKDGEEALKQIANDNNGQYKYISEKDLKALADGAAPAKPPAAPPKTEPKAEKKAAATPAPTVIIGGGPAPDAAKAAAAKTVAVKIVSADPVVFQVVGQKGDLTLQALAELLILQRMEADRKGEALRVAVQVDPVMPYVEIARVMLACGKAEVTGISLNDLAIQLPRSSGPVAGKPVVAVARLKIELLDTGSQDPNAVGGKNEFCQIQVEGKDLGADFGALQKLLEAKMNAGLPANTPIRIAPTMACQWKWAQRAADVAKTAGFNNIQFAVPYE
jgi:biopolymer transport protein ExbD